MAQNGYVDVVSVVVSPIPQLHSTRITEPTTVTTSTTIHKALKTLQGEETKRSAAPFMSDFSVSVNWPWLVRDFTIGLCGQGT